MVQQSRSTNRSSLSLPETKQNTVPNRIIQDKNGHLMDKIEPGKELNEDVTREQLIAISYGVPDTDLTAETSPKNTDSEKVIEPLIGDGEEKYRSKLISISYSPSPDVEVLPVLPGQLDG